MNIAGNVVLNVQWFQFREIIKVPNDLGTNTRHVTILRYPNEYVNTLEIMESG